MTVATQPSAEGSAAMVAKAENPNLRKARQSWRLCAAAEVAFAKHGMATKVEYILKLAGMSRRSFYEFYRDLQDIDDKMLFHRVTSGFGPCANWMQWVRNPAVKGQLGGDATEAFKRARMVAEREPAEVPQVDVLLAWFEGRKLRETTEAPAVAVKYAIKNSAGTFYRRTTSIGPMFGGTSSDLRVFDTEAEAHGVMGTHSFAFGDCEVVPVGAEAAQ